MKLNFSFSKKTVKKIAGFPKLIALHALLWFFVLTILAFAIATVTYYLYGSPLEKAQNPVVSSTTYFEESAYSSIISHWQVQQERYETAKTRDYPDPFRLTE